jgi:ribosomal protein S26
MSNNQWDDFIVEENDVVEELDFNDLDNTAVQSEYSILTDKKLRCELFAEIVEVRKGSFSNLNYFFLNFFMGLIFNLA